MNKIFSVVLLCATVMLASCSKNDDPAMVEKVSLDKTTLTIAVGETATLTATVTPADATLQDVNWISGDKSVATVNDQGVVTAVNVGKATITVATRSGDKSASCVVTVTAAPIAVTGVTLNKTALSLVVGGSETLTATVLPENATDKTVAWSSSNAAVATVNVATGEVTAVAKGETTITATATSNTKTTGTCKVTVTEKSSLTWATGNLIADGANGAKIGKTTDKGLFFQFGSLIGWSETDPIAIAVSPIGYTGSTSWDSNWTGNTATEDAATGTGDPCKYYLKGTWRLPTKDEYLKLFNTTITSWAGATDWSWTTASATHKDGLTFPASGSRKSSDGSLSSVESAGYYWSASPHDSSNAYNLIFFQSGLFPFNGNPQSIGFSVRCVHD